MIRDFALEKYTDFNKNFLHNSEILKEKVKIILIYHESSCQFSVLVEN